MDDDILNAVLNYVDELEGSEESDECSFEESELESSELSESSSSSESSCESDGEQGLPSPRKGRKRMRRPEKHKVNIRKRRKAMGDPTFKPFNEISWCRVGIW